MPPRVLLGKLAIITSAIMAPLWIILAYKWPIDTDFIFYATSLKAFSTQFWSGELYPRWLSHVNDGMGSPVFLFYGPLAFYLSYPLEFLASFDPNGFGRVLLGMQLALIAGGITCYRWLRQSFSEPQAAQGALTYAGFPFFIFILYLNFGLAQLWAVALFPLLLEATNDLIRSGRRAVLKLSAAYALLLFTHLPSALVFGMVPPLYAIMFSPGKRRRIFAEMLFAGLLGCALAMVYLYPAFANKAFIASDHFLDGKYDYRTNFMDIHVIGGALLLLVPLLGFALELSKTARKTIVTREVIFWHGILFAALFMAFPLSKPLWDIFPPLHYLQFPFRFMFAAIPGVVWISVQYLPHIKSRVIYALLSVLMLGAISLYSANTFFFTSDRPLREILDHALVAVPEYQTQWMATYGVDMQRDVPSFLGQMDPVTFIDGDGRATAEYVDSRHFRLRANVVSASAEIKFRYFYFPGWVTDSPAATVTESFGLLSVKLPEGDYDLMLTLPWFKGEREGMCVSVIALLAWISLAVYWYRPMRKTDAHPR